MLVCGLGRVGRSCILALRGYHVPVRAIDFRVTSEVADALGRDALFQGDFREPDVLRQAGIEQCRSIVLVSSDSAANIEGALAARRANPEIRLVVRAEEQSWHTLLAQQLGELVVYEPNRLSAATFAFAALDSHVLAHFYVDEHLFQVLERVVEPADPWLGHTLESLHPVGRQAVLHIPASPEPAQEVGGFYAWEPARKLAAGDRLILLGTENALGGFEPRSSLAPRPLPLWAEWRRKLQARRNRRLDRPAAIALSGLLALALLVIAASCVFAWGPLDLPLPEALRTALTLLVGGHLADVFSRFDELPRSLHWLEIVLVLSGTLLTAVLYALLTEFLLRARFELRPRRPRMPSRDHVIVAGLGQTGERIASLLDQLHCKVVAIEKSAIDPQVLPRLPIVSGNAAAATTLEEAGIATARGLIAATSEDQLNVEIALLATKLNPSCRIAVRTFDPRFRENIAFLLPKASVLCVSSLAATAYAAAALGEHVIHLFQTPVSQVLVVEYRVTGGDTLIDHPLWELAEGYAIVPVLWQRHDEPAHIPGQDDMARTLRAGDRLVVLATAPSLEAIERGALRTPDHEIELVRLRPYAESIQVVAMLSQRLGYTLEQAHTTLAQLPRRAPRRLYGLYASRTARMLNNNGLEARVVKVDA